jgi:transglycosylase-like protein with SLT domain/sporulation related protein
MQAPVMSVHRSSIMAFGLLVLSECVAFGGGNDQVNVQLADAQGEHKLGDTIDSRGESQNGSKVEADKQQGKTIARATDAIPRSDLQGSNLQDSVCLMIEAAGRAHDLPQEFFARVIWQESRFRSDTVGPRRRNGQSAQGIAQFMPTTAAERGLLDPFDPVQALPKAAQFLRELKDQFGNLGLAAAAYNAGPARVRGWLAGTRRLSAETRNYVAAVTGVPADEWAKGGARKPSVKTSPNCRELMALLQPASPQGTPPSPHGLPAQSQNDQLAKNDPIGGRPAEGDVVTPHQEASHSHGGMVKQPASPKDPSPSPHGSPAQSQNDQLAKNDPIRGPPFGPLEGDVVTPHQEASHSHGDMNLFLEKLTERVKLTADSPWSIQLSAGFSRERVLAAYATIATRYAGILAGRDASILSSVFRSRGTGAFYQIRVGTDTFESATNLCADIRRAGGACMVLRNSS